MSYEVQVNFSGRVSGELGLRVEQGIISTERRFKAINTSALRNSGIGCGGLPCLEFKAPPTSSMGVLGLGKGPDNISSVYK